jgi:1,2-diacylglycerol 3-alpha-glucosyltransferase
MNIGIITTWFERGAAYVSKAYVQALSRDHNVFIYARGGEAFGIGESEWDHDYVTWGKHTKDFHPTFINYDDFYQWIVKNKLDLLLFNEQASWSVLLKCAKLPILMGAYIDYYTPETVHFFDIYDFLFCNTERHFSVFNNHPQSFYIPWGTNINVYTERTKRNVHTPVKFFHSAGMGGIGLRKGTDILIKAFQKVKGPAELIIHSQAGIDRYGSVASLIENDKRVTFIHSTVGAPGLYHLGDVYVYPTKLEGIGLTILEAMSSGLPVITTDDAPMNEFVSDGHTGKLAKVSAQKKRRDNYYWPESFVDETDLAASMQFYIDNPGIIVQHSAAARNYVVDYRDWEKNSKELSLLLPRIKNCRTSDPRVLNKIHKFENTKRIDYFLAKARSAYRKKAYKSAIKKYLITLKLFIERYRKV